MFSCETVASSIVPLIALFALIPYFPFAFTLAFQRFHIPQKAIIKKQTNKKPQKPRAQCSIDPELREKLKRKKEEKKKEEEKQRVKLWQRDKISLLLMSILYSSY